MILGWNFADGHLHNEQLLGRAGPMSLHPGELRVVMLESQPIQGRFQHYRIVDAATGTLEDGDIAVDDMVIRQPWLDATRTDPGDQREDACHSSAAVGESICVVTDAIVVGAGPNGLAAAIALAQRGLEVTVLEAADEIGGGTRTRELITPGVRHDICSAVHPFGVASPFLRSLDLEGHGLTWRWPEIDLAHPLDGGRAGVMVRSLDDTASGLGRDGASWRKLFEPIARGFDRLTQDVFQPALHLPKHPVDLGRFGVRALQPATFLARRWQDDEARALFAGVAAHTFSR